MAGIPGPFWALPRSSTAMSGIPTEEWRNLETPENPANTLRGKDRSVLQRQLEALLAKVTDPLIEGVWLDATFKDPIWIDAAEARRKAGLPDVVGRRVVGSQIDG
jgi:hypothetical protein